MPSQKVLEQKQQVVEQLAEKLKTAVSVVVVDYKGISVANDTALRAELRAAGVEYLVVKNSLLKYACEKTGFGDFLPALEGTTAIAVSAADAIAPARIVQKYAGKLGEVFNMKIGYVDGRFVQPADLKAIAQLPSRDVLIAMVAGSLKGIVSSLARAVAEVAKKRGEAA